MAHELSGVVVVNKPSGPTSFDVVRRVKGLFKAKRCGHTGTLDPTATGVLPICIGDATKRSEEHTSELQSRLHLVCRLLLEKKKNHLAGRANRPTYASHLTPIIGPSGQPANPLLH